jgi:hypothetical protein
MPETSTILQDGVDRFREAAETLTTELRARRKKLEKRLQTGRKDLEKRFSTQRKDLGKRLETQRKQIEKRTQKLRSEIEKNPAIKRLDTMRKDAAKQIEQGVADVLNALQIASRSDLQRVDRKISALSKQVKEMNKRKRPNGSASPTA